MDVFIFFFGLLVTVVAGGAVATIWWAALRDGQTDAQERSRRAAAERDAGERPGADPVTLSGRPADDDEDADPVPIRRVA